MATGEGERIQHSTIPVVEYSEIMPVRELFRTQNYLMKPMEVETHTSLDHSIKLSENLHNFTAEAEERRKLFYENMLDADGDIHVPIVYVTEQEMIDKTSLSSQSIPAIQKQIFLLFEDMTDSESKLMEELFNKTVRGKRKATYIDFYHSLKQDI
ncbi:MAG: hypothetical protein ABW185_26925 [Sedimenticola sp.]